MDRTAKTVTIAQAAARQAALWRVALISQGLNVATLSRDVPVAAFIEGHGHPGDLLLVDLARLAVERTPLSQLAGVLHGRDMEARLVATLGSRFEVAEPEQRWAQEQGALDLFPGISLAQVERNTSRWLRRALVALGHAPPECARLRAFLRVLEPDPGSATDADGRALAELERRGISLDALARKMRGPSGVARGDWRYRLKVYPDCFVGSEAIGWIARACRSDRETALAVGQAMHARGIFHHVVKEHALRDENLYYRFACDSRRIDAIGIDELCQRMRAPGGVDIRDRLYHGKTYRACFVGEETVQWMTRNYDLSPEEAASLGQRLVDLGLVHHVLDEHDLADGYYFYRFYADEKS